MKTVRHHSLFGAIIAILITAACACLPFKGGDNAIKDAIARQLEQYPESTVQDIYKNFCQDNIGPGHLIPDVQSARAYLLSELEAYRADLNSGRYEAPAQRCVYVGDAGNYVRVDLSVVLDSLVDAEKLLDAFVRSANEGKTVSPAQWKRKWRKVAGVIRKDFPDIPGDVEEIDSLIARGYLILHHSEPFRRTYHPHYRLVAKSIFKSELMAIADEGREETLPVKRKSIMAPGRGH